MVTLLSASLYVGLFLFWGAPVNFLYAYDGELVLYASGGRAVKSIEILRLGMYCYRNENDPPGSFTYNIAGLEPPEEITLRPTARLSVSTSISLPLKRIDPNEFHMDTTGPTQLVDGQLYSVTVHPQETSADVWFIRGKFYPALMAQEPLLETKSRKRFYNYYDILRAAKDGPTKKGTAEKRRR